MQALPVRSQSILCPREKREEHEVVVHLSPRWAPPYHPARRSGSPTAGHLTAAKIETVLDKDKERGNNRFGASRLGSEPLPASLLPEQDFPMAPFDDEAFFRQNSEQGVSAGVLAARVDDPALFARESVLPAEPSSCCYFARPAASYPNAEEDAIAEPPVPVKKDSLVPPPGPACC